MEGWTGIEAIIAWSKAKPDDVRGLAQALGEDEAEMEPLAALPDELVSDAFATWVAEKKPGLMAQVKVGMVLNAARLKFGGGSLRPAPQEEAGGCWHRGRGGSEEHSGDYGSATSTTAAEFTGAAAATAQPVHRTRLRARTTGGRCIRGGPNADGIGSPAWGFHRSFGGWRRPGQWRNHSADVSPQPGSGECRSTSPCN